MALDDMIIRPKYEEGMRIDFVPRPGNQHGPGGKHGLGKLPEHHVIGAHQKAIEAGQGLRKRALIDRIVSRDGEGQIRLMLDDTMELVWATYDEIQPLDSISQLGDLVGPASRSLKDGLRELREKETKEAAKAAEAE